MYATLKDKHLKIASRLAKLLDSQFKIFGKSFGIDPIIGLLPIVGDFVPLILSSYIVWIGYSLKVAKSKLVRMILNVVIDYALGIVPIIGDFADFGFKSNDLNLKIINGHINSQKTLNNTQVKV